MRSLWVLVVAAFLYGCGGSSANQSSTVDNNLAGSYVGNWSTSQNGSVDGAATVDVNLGSAVTLNLATAASDPPQGVAALSADGTVDAMGNFTGNTTSSPPQPLSGTIQRTSTGLTATIATASPGMMSQWFITATKE